MSDKKILSQGNVPFSWEQNPGVSKLSFRDFQALALRSSRAPASSIDIVVSNSTKIPPPPPCRYAAKGARGWEEDDPFLVAYKECTKSGSSKGGGLVGVGVADVKKKKSKLFGFSCKSIDSCDVRDHRDTFFKLRSDGGIRVSSWKYEPRP